MRLVAFPILVMAVCVPLAFAPLRAEEALTDAQIGKWIEQLGTDKPDMAAAAMQKLEDAGLAALPALEAASVDHEAADVRYRAGKLAGLVRTRRCDLEALEASNRELENLRNSVAPLLFQLDDSDPVRVRAAALLLGDTYCSEPAVCKVLDRYVPRTDRGSDAKVYVLNHMADWTEDQKFKGDALQSRLAARQEALDWLLGVGAAEIADWIADLSSDDFETRDLAAKQLEVHADQCLPALMRAAKESDDPQIRARASQVRLRCYLKVGINADLWDLEDEEPGVRCDAILNICKAFRKNPGVLESVVRFEPQNPESSKLKETLLNTLRQIADEPEKQQVTAEEFLRLRLEVQMLKAQRGASRPVQNIVH